MKLAILALTLSACIPLGRNEHLSELAREEWTRVGAAERWAALPIHGQRCVGLPGAIGGEALDVYVPFPWSEWDFAARIIMRYEMSKGAWQLHGSDPDGSLRWYFPLVFLDGLLHLPPSELHSWYRVLVPGEVQR